MNEEYFVPQLEDFRFGYEYEVGSKRLLPGQPSDKTYIESWQKRIISHYLDFEGLDYYIDEGLFRTPFLTKEQIENEGWINNYLNHFLKGEWELERFSNNEISLGRDLYYPNYKGECKSINEFRYILKLLKI